MNVEVRNNPAKQRYELWVDGERVGHAKYRLGHGRIAFVHTKIYEPHESTVICPCHGSEFDVESGEVLRGPASEPVETFEVRLEDGNLEVKG